ncbi:DMT family transporter [Paracoccus seriniphilus]|uniref:Threonine/homoserine efflux transporter RhtA n=1 Tax=Paracoccus seriniphilus TaxID=184748 RepID=A0A239PXH3_9RHOB|nr:DMT family transporter [Paracoccus seriniphilus]WCR14112.1 DMT family transporter [Paracoccus seriniphilus]SNT75019.1 Threonine/homoserine efflux transporter RhtA [Paracoccus seriniphilus]
MDLRAILMGLVFGIMWASAFTSTRMIVTEIPPLMALSLRFALSGVLGVLIAFAMGQTWKNLTRNQWRAIVILGLCQNALYLGLNWVAMQWIQAGLASIIAATMPLIVALLGWLFMGERLKPIGVLGLALGVAGVAVIMGARLQGGSDPVGIAMCFLAALALAIATLTVRGASSGGNVMMIVGLQMLVGAATLALISPLFETWSLHMSARGLIAFIYTVLVPGIAATWVWFILVGRIGAVRAATFHFLTPFLGVTIAAAFLGESLGPSDVVGALIVAIGILMVQISKVNSITRT